jgi:NodT family efflux transporter outer membrane factor (OMF) lipoprotein
MKRNYILVGLTFTVLFALSCAIPKPITLNKTELLPLSFEKSLDSNSIATIPKKLFFPDKSLQQLIDTALQYNSDIRIAIQRISAAKTGFGITQGLTKLSLDAVISTSIDKFGDYTMNGLGNYDMNLSPNIRKDQQIPLNMPDFFVGFRSSWEADIWGKLSNQKKAAFNKYLATEQVRQWVTTQLVAQVASLYYELLALDKELEILKHNIKLQENAVEIVKIQKAGGRATELAVQQFTAQLLSTKSMLYVMQQKITETENILSSIAGKYDMPIKRGIQITALTIPEEVQMGLPAQLLINRPDIRAAELLLKAAGAELEATRKAFLPSLNISAYTALNSFKSSVLFSPQSLAYGLLGGLVTPVLSKNMLKGNYQLATVAQQEAFETYRKQIIYAYNEVQTQLSGIEQYKKIYQLKVQETQGLQAAVAASNDLYIGGYATYLEVVTAQQGVLEAELDQINSKKIVFLYLIDLYKSLGGGWN